MGLFGLFKRKKAQTSRKKDVIKQIEKANDLGSIATVLAKNNLISVPKDKYHNSFGEDIRKPTPEGELPWGWVTANKNFTEPLERRKSFLSDALYASKQRGVLARKEALIKYIGFLEQSRATCAARGKCFLIWYNDLLTHKGEIEELKEELGKIESNLDAMLAQEKALKQLKSDLLAIIKAEPGVVQSDLYKRFDISMKNHISNELYQLDAHRVIMRIKSGRSYKLYMK